MELTFSVGVTHWMNFQRQKGLIPERTEHFFAPFHIMTRIKE